MKNSLTIDPIIPVVLSIQRNNRKHSTNLNEVPVAFIRRSSPKVFVRFPYSQKFNPGCSSSWHPWQITSPDTSFWRWYSTTASTTLHFSS